MMVLGYFLVVAHTPGIFVGRQPIQTVAIINEYLEFREFGL
jgi:hypothetical protein